MMKNLWKRLINTPASDPDDERRRRLLNIVLVIMALLMIVVFIIVIAMYFARVITGEDLRITITIPIALVCVAGLYLLGRYVSTSLAGIIFEIFLLTMLIFGDSAGEVADGRSSLFFVIPIIAASMLVRPVTSFVIAFIASAIQFFLSLQLGIVPNVLNYATFIITATFSWLLASTLETAIQDLRKNNRELDQRVADRTHELSEALIREQAEASKNRAILQGIADSVLVFDLQGRVISVNPTFARLVQTDMQAIIGRTFSDLLNSSSHAGEPQRELIQTTFEASEGPQPVQIQMGAKTFSLLVSPVLLETDEPMGKVAILHDITHEVEVSNMKSAFVSMVSHELRTPLSAAMGLIELFQIEMEGKLAESQAYMIERVVANHQKLLKLVNDLLDLAKMEAGTLMIQSAPFSPSELLKTLAETMARLVVEKNLQLVTSLQPEIPETLVSDPERLNQILVNLVTNALKFTDQGQIDVRLFMSDSQNLGLEVSDTGQGIPPEALGRIFDPFWQVDSSISRKHGGAGLGLSIIQRLVDLMHGSIRVQSVVDHGSTFTVVIPVQVVLPAK